MHGIPDLATENTMTNRCGKPSDIPKHINELVNCQRRNQMS